ncbi:MAG: MFS transporter [Bacteroidetes bacterium]|nr:MFS transporter [Bacteroidota bacterium]
MEYNWKKNTILFLASQTISLFGTMLVQYAIMWHIVLKTQSSTMMTIYIIAGLFPTFFTSLFGGVWADKYNKKHIINIADGSIAVVSLAIAVSLFAGYDSIILLLVAGAVRALGQGVQQPAVNSFTPMIVPAENLLRINGIVASIQSGIFILAPIVSASLMAFASLQTIFLIDVITAAIAILILYFLVKVKNNDIKDNDENKNTYKYTNKWAGRNEKYLVWIEKKEQNMTLDIKTLGRYIKNRKRRVRRLDEQIERNMKLNEKYNYITKFKNETKEKIELATKKQEYLIERVNIIRKQIIKLIEIKQKHLEERALRQEKAITQSEKTANHSHFADLINGLKYIKKEKYLWQLIIFVTLFWIAMSPVCIMTPLQVTRNFGADLWRLTAIEIAWAGGMILGGVLVGIFSFRNRIYSMTLSVLVFGLMTILLGLLGNFIPYLICMAVVGIFYPYYNAPYMTLMQERVDSAYLGRVLSVFTMVGSVAMPFGMLVFGPLGDIINIDWILIFTGAIMLLLCLLLFFNKALRTAGRSI